MNLTSLRKPFFLEVKSLSAGNNADIADLYLNMAYLEVYRAHRWPQRKRNGQVVLIPNYTTGTCTVTQYNGSNSDAAKTVTFSTALTQDMVGRYLRASGSSYWHKIIHISGSTAYLDTEVIDVSGSLSFEIWKRFYYLSSDVDVVLDFDKWANGSLSFRPNSQLIDEVSDISTVGTPYDFSDYGIDPYDDVEYSTGTIQITADSNIVVGVDTSWLTANVKTMDILRVNENDYYVKRIESNLRIILYNSVENGVTANSTYTVRKNNPVGFQFYNQTDGYRILNFSYLAKAAPLIHPDNDHILLPEEFRPAIISRAVSFALNGEENNRALIRLSTYSSELQGLKEKARVVHPRSSQFAPKIHSSAPGR